MTFHFQALQDSLVLNRLGEFYFGHIRRKKIPIVTPLFRINSSQRELASWDPSRRFISISRDLLNHFTSRAVECVLLHEMAHQVVTDVYHLPPDHGPAFQRACQWVEVPLGLRMATVDLDTLKSYENIGGESNPDEEATLRRLEKLLALSQSSNEHESLLAMKRLQELMRSDHFSRIRGLTGPGKAHIVREDLATSRVPSHIWLITSLLSKHYFVRVVCIRGYDPKTGKDTVYLEMVGQKVQAHMALYVFNYLRRQVEFLWQRYKAEKGCLNRFKSSYLRGLLNGFDKKLGACVSSEEKHLIHISDPLVDRLFRERYPETRTVRAGGQAYVYGDIYKEGLEEGSQIVIAPPLDKKTSGQPCLLLEE